MLNFEPQPICKCTTACQCGVIKSLMDYENQEQIMLFLNGIMILTVQQESKNLLFDPLPSLTKVYEMVLSQEWQKWIFMPVSDDSVE